MRLLYLVLEDTISKSPYEKSLEVLSRRGPDGCDRSIIQWEETIAKRFNAPHVIPKSQHDDIKRYANPSRPPPVERNGLYLRTNWYKSRKACTRHFTDYNKSTQYRSSLQICLKRRE